jgi:fumarate reductase flavoprotein subunit
MGVELGAATVNMRSFYGHTLVRDAVANDRLWPGPNPEPLVDAGILVDGHGRRIVDEFRGDAQYAEIADAISGPIAWSDTPNECWAVFDRRTWETVGPGAACGLNPLLLEERGTMAVGGDVRDLARAAGLPAEELDHTVESFNRFCSGGAPLEPPRSGPVRALEPPFHAIPLVVGITFTMGGLLVNETGRVQRPDGTTIAGLYAAGGTMGGLQGGPANRGYAGGWSEAATFGLLAGGDAARAA